MNDTDVISIPPRGHARGEMCRGAQALLDVWFATTPIDVEPCFDAIEQVEMNRLLFERDRRRSLSAHSLKRRLLASYCDDDMPPQHLRFRRRLTGKPFLSHPRREDSALEFNVSHSEDAFALAVSTQPVGVDIQWQDPAVDFEALATIVFHPAEFALWKRDGARTELFYQLWTAKEAVMKAEGSGFLREPRQVDASGWAANRCVAVAGGRVWSVFARRVGEYSLCVATPASVALEPVWRQMHNLGSGSEAASDFLGGV